MQAHLLYEGVQALDVLHGMGQDIDFRHLLVTRGGRDHDPEPLEPAVDGLDPVALPGVPLHDLHVLGRLDLVAVDWVQDNKLWFRSHYNVFICSNGRYGGVIT